MKTGFTLVEIAIVVAIIAIIGAIAIPNFLKARENGQLNSVLNNLRLIESAKDQWALENKRGTGDTLDWTSSATGLGGYIKFGTVKDVAGETYNLNAIGTAATATIAGKLGTYAQGATIQ